MRLITLQFDFPSVDSYKRLLDVWKYSAQKHMPEATIEIIHCAPPQKVSNRNTGLITNTAKLSRWIEAMERCKDEEIIFCDCDLLFLGDMEDAFREYKFDIAQTFRHHVEHGKARIPINGGVLFVRNNERTLHFMKEYLRINNEMYCNPEFHAPYRLKYAGMNQSAVGYLLEHPELHECKLIDLPCAKWNNCNTEWHLFNNDTRCIHFKSQLRRAALNQAPSNGVMQPFVNLWRKYESEMKREGKNK